MKVKTNLRLMVTCPRCGIRFPAHFTAADSMVTGTCVACGHMVNAHAPHLAEQLQRSTAAAVQEALGEQSATTAGPPRSPAAITDTAGGNPVATGRDAASATAVRAIARAVNAGACCTALWGFIDPTPYRLVVTLLMAWPAAALAAVLWSKGAIQLLDKPRTRSDHVAYALLTPILVLAIRMMMDMHIADYQPFWSPFAAVTLVVLMVFLRAGAAFCNMAPKTRLLLVPFLAAYGYGITAASNAILDHSMPASFHPLVVGQDVSSGGRGGTSYYLALSPWEGQTGTVRVMVPRPLYDRVKVKDHVLVRQWEGHWGIPWFTVQRER